MEKIDQAIAKAAAYGHGLVAIPNPPSNVIAGTKSGFCDYCNIKRPVILQTPDKEYGNYPLTTGKYMV